MRSVKICSSDAKGMIYFFTKCGNSLFILLPVTVIAAFNSPHICAREDIRLIYGYLLWKSTKQISTRIRTKISHIPSALRFCLKNYTSKLTTWSENTIRSEEENYRIHKKCVCCYEKNIQVLRVYCNVFLSCFLGFFLHVMAYIHTSVQLSNNFAQMHEHSLSQNCL